MSQTLESTGLLVPHNTLVLACPTPKRTVSRTLVGASARLETIIALAPSPIRRQPSPKVAPFNSIELAAIGIKVRDFAYEHHPWGAEACISRVPTRPLFFQPRALFQDGTNTDDDFEMNTPTPTPSMCAVTKPTLERITITRRDGIANTWTTQSSLLGPVEPHMYDDWDYPQSQPLASQESEVDVGTPLITPHGSTQWLEDAFSQPASLPVSQSAGPDPFAFDDGFSQVPDDHMDCHPLPELAPAPDVAADKLQVHDSRTSTPLSRLTTPPLSNASSPLPPVSPAPRYNLRKRPSPTSHLDEPPTNRPRTRTRPPNSQISRDSANSKTSQPARNPASKRSSSRPKSRTRTKRS